MSDSKLGRREFMRRGVRASVGLGFLQATDSSRAAVNPPIDPDGPPAPQGCGKSSRLFNGIYQAPHTDQIAFPLGGMGAGMVCLEGSGALSCFSLRHRAELERQCRVFAAVSIKGTRPAARLLEGPVPAWKLRPQFPGQDANSSWGLPRFHAATFEARFPFATVALEAERIPLQVSLMGWSPFSPGDADNASLPVAGLEYRFGNSTNAAVEAVFSFNAENFLADPPGDSVLEDAHRLDRIHAMKNGFVLYGPGAQQRSWDAGHFAAWIDEPGVLVNGTWPCDSPDVLWQRFESGDYRSCEPFEDRPAGGASVFVPFTLGPDETKTITVCLAWYVPHSDLFQPQKGYMQGKLVAYPHPAQCYQPWYAGRFPGIEAVAEYWRSNYSSLKEAAQLFSRTLHDSTLPPEVMEAVASNLSILKSTTVLRQPDGRLWGWEGSYVAPAEMDCTGVAGTTTHVWNYAQAIPHLFPSLERGLRETEFGSNQNEQGLQYCRTPLPIRPVDPGHTVPDGIAADGQLGGIIKVYREWRISGDTAWLRRLWPAVRASLDFCIRTWDPAHRGWIEEPHLTTYDMEFWGPDSLCTSLYIGALEAAIAMGNALDSPVKLYSELLLRGVRQMQQRLFNGEYFVQLTDWKGLRASFRQDDLFSIQAYGASPEAGRLMNTEGPAGQCGSGCLSDGVMGMWLCRVSGLGSSLAEHQVESHLEAVYHYNFKQTLAGHSNLVRPSFACNDEPGLLLCNWPRGGRPSRPMAYSDEVWTGIEYQVASHLIMLGKIDAGLGIVRAARTRYDGCIRNPFSEVEAGHWYARAMSSYALLQAFSGARFDAVDKTLYLRPVIKGNFRCFLSTQTGFGTVGVKDGKPFVEVVSGHIPYRQIDYSPA